MSTMNAARISRLRFGITMANTSTLLLLLSPFAAAQDPSLERLNASPRHHEWVKITHGDRTLEAFVVYPEVSGKTPVVIVIHENRGLNDWARSAADQVAEAGYIAIAPDLLSGMGPNGGKTSDFADADAARDALYAIPQDQITADLNAVADYAQGIDAANGQIAVAGFCWGGAQSFRFASTREDLDAAFVFYGTALESPEDIAKIKAPVYGFYGGNDARITAAVPKTEKLMKIANKKYEPVVYEGAGHGFMRSGEDASADPANRSARDQAWERWKNLLEDITKRDNQ